jgi:hypothetical protein
MSLSSEPLGLNHLVKAFEQAAHSSSNAQERTGTIRGRCVQVRDPRTKADHVGGLLKISNGVLLCLKRHLKEAMEVGPSGGLPLRPCGFEREAQVMTVGWFHPCILPPPRALAVSGSAAVPLHQESNEFSCHTGRGSGSRVLFAARSSKQGIVLKSRSSQTGNLVKRR